MCKELCHEFYKFSLIPVLVSDKFPKYLCRRKEKGYRKFSNTLLSRQFESSDSSIMALGFCKNCSSTNTTVTMSPNINCKNVDSTDVCPYCRSSRSEMDTNLMCSQQSSNIHKNSVETHQQLTNSQQYYSRPCVGYVSTECRCAKNILSTKCSPISRTNYVSSADGWRALQLILLGILVVLPTSTMSNPVSHHSQRSGGSPRSSGHHHHSPHRGNERPMKWINPCRIPTSIPTQPSEIQMPIQSDEEIFQNIVTQARKAEVQARRFFEDFRDECFGKSGHDFQQLHYDWLKDVAEKVDKTLGEPVTQERLDTLEVEDILKSMYRGLQKLAVGLEQVVLDQAIHGGSFYQHFHEAEFQLKYVLCEFQIAMMEKNIQYEDVTREIMDKHFVKLDDKTWRNLRDFSIFRDYLNTLEFIRESFQHFWKRSKDSS